jgi:hypothetical protein
MWIIIIKWLDTPPIGGVSKWQIIAIYLYIDTYIYG